MRSATRRKLVNFIEGHLIMYLDAFYKYLKFEKRYSIYTLEAYRTDLKHFSAFIETVYQAKDPDLLQISYRHVKAWIISLIDKKVTAKTVNRKISSLKAYFRFLSKRGLIKSNPMLKIRAPKISRPLPVFIEQKSMYELFDEIHKDDSSDNPVSGFIFLRNKLILELLYATGIRRAELIGLKEGSFDFFNRTIKVLGKGNKERIIPTGEKLILLTKKYISERNRIFGGTEHLIVTAKGEKAYPRLIHRVVGVLLQDVANLTRKSPHVLRHTFATHLSNNGAELNAVKELLGHASLASTQIYTHSTIAKLKEIHRLAHPRG